MLSLKILAGLWIIFIIICLIIFGNLTRSGTVSQAAAGTGIAAWFIAAFVMIPATGILLVAALVEYATSGPVPTPAKTE
jgi:TRAP-type C4-dicarboxylate transport system permease small subunit